MRVTSPSLLIISSLLLSGCVMTSGHPEIQTVTFDDVRGLTKEQIVARYGPPASKQVTHDQGQTHETWRWNYHREVFLSSVSSTSLLVRFDQAGRADAMTSEHYPP